MALLYLCSIIHLACRWDLIRRSFLLNGQTQGTALLTLTQQPVWLLLLQNTSYAMGALLGDAVLLWRCWAIWGRDWRVIILPGASWLVALVLCIFNLLSQGVPEVEDLLYQHSFVISSLSFFFLATTLICTLLIISRVVYIMNLSIERSYQWQILPEAIIESGAFLSLNLIVLVALYTKPDFSAAYPEAISVTMAGITSTLITARISLGWGRPDNGWKRTDLSNLSSLWKTATALQETDVSTKGCESNYRPDQTV
ncbi:hypothetical protein M422DRAFT_55988 [Sphaerobolus stellatus SS14]|uniref:Uncharacterized protein n=1 Tax=Sphaerobolus stellatus (strain SS14) TaxID=990650 RepID=A0A0C9UJH4_SPHS4|nr:hypothetical protein M422DRAFT_55988 [Sphaerobolus stellatus SS14]